MLDSNELTHNINTIIYFIIFVLGFIFFSGGLFNFITSYENKFITASELITGLLCFISVEINEINNKIKLNGD